MQHDFILLDRSQSMSEKGKWAEALASCNDYVKKLAEDKVDTRVTLAAFDKNRDQLDYKVLRENSAPANWNPVGADDEVQPRGWTPLNDAIGRLVADAKKGNYEKAAIIIITDGEENSSKELTKEAAMKLLDDCRKRGWQVVFLGADYENMQQARGYGNKDASTVAVAAGNMSAAMRATATLRASYAVGAGTMEYDEETKKRLSKEQWKS